MANWYERNLCRFIGSTMLASQSMRLWRGFTDSIVDFNDLRVHEMNSPYEI